MIRLLAACALTVLAACAPRPAETPQPEGPQTVSVLAAAETAPVASLDDAADDPAIWRNAANPAESLIIGTDKKAGLHAYGLDGAIRARLPDGLLNNVDLRADVLVNGAPAIVLAASDRTDLQNGHLALYTLTPPPEVAITPLARFPAEIGEAYGVCLYRRAADQALFAFLIAKDGQTRQFALDFTGPAPKATIVRRFAIASQAEGCVADDRTGELYIGEENLGVWRYSAEPDGLGEGAMFAKIDNAWLTADVEGLAIAPAGGRAGRLIVSSQGDNAYALFDLETAQPLGRFRIADGPAIDGTVETDGIELALGDFGASFPGGVFVAQDGDNAPEAQNFKLVRWADVEAALGAPSGNN